MRDLLPPALRVQQAVERELAAVQESFGYAAVELPVLEHRELYLRKLGEELVGRVYEFSFAGRELALRPEWTASVLRAYVAQMQDQPLPLRVRYSGPVFRYERPQRATYRQFSQHGVELIGGPAPRADAEVIALACAGLDRVGVTGYQLVLGHIGLVRAFLDQLELDERVAGLLAWSLDKLRKEGVAAVRARVAEAQGEQGFDPALAGLLQTLDDAQARALLLGVLEALQVNVQFGTRAPEAIVDRLLRKLRRADPQPRVERALAFLERLSAIRGTPEAALAQAAALLAEYALPGEPLAELHAIQRLLAAHGLPAERLVIDFGLGRGLHYYTGAIFEIYSADGMQLCGGGRYDDLVTALGGAQTVPAVGFAYGLERVVGALEQQGHLPPDARPPEVLVAASDDAVYSYALRVAARLRQLGYAAALDVRGRSAASNLRHALRREARFLVLVGPDEAVEESVIWRDLTARDELRYPLASLPAWQPATPARETR
jgi:histidyl-tRNA synthetase